MMNFEWQKNIQTRDELETRDIDVAAHTEITQAGGSQRALSQEDRFCKTYDPKIFRNAFT